MALLNTTQDIVSELARISEAAQCVVPRNLNNFLAAAFPGTAIFMIREMEQRPFWAKKIKIGTGWFARGVFREYPDWERKSFEVYGVPETGEICVVDVFHGNCAIIEVLEGMGFDEMARFGKTVCDRSSCRDLLKFSAVLTGFKHKRQQDAN